MSGLVEIRGGSLRRGLLIMGCATVFALAGGRAATAQTEIDPPKPYELTDGNGVSLIGLSVSAPTNTIGTGQPAQGGLSYSATWDGGASAWRHSISGGIYQKRDQQFQEYQWYTVTVMGQSVEFRADGFGNYEVVHGSGTGTLTLNGSIWTYTANDGTVATFDKGLSTYWPYRANQGVITRIVKPDGETIDFTYTSRGTGTGAQRRIQSVTNNLGHALHFDYASEGAGEEWGRFTKVTAFNMAVEYCAPAATSCSFNEPWPNLTFGQTGITTVTERSVTDSLGRELRLLSPAGGRVTGVARPSTTVGQNLTFTYDSMGRVANAFDGSGTWTYATTTWPNPGDDSYYTTTTVTDPLSHATAYRIEWDNPTGDPVSSRLNRLVRITDALNQVTDIVQDGTGLREVTFPEGNRVQYPRNLRGDPTGIVRTSKDGTQTTSLTAHYDDCSTPVRCGRPTRIVDARGATTNISYFAHGGVDTVIRPAPTTGAVRPEIHNTYAQLHAWYRNGGASHVQGSAVWRPTGTSTCATAATCPGGAGEVVSYTTYEAGSASVRSNLLPLTSTSGSGDGLLLATTTTTWDINGDPVTVDGPLSGDVTRYFHDAMRQQIGVIGPDPDGAGGRAFPATKTQYNADGQIEQTWRGTTAGQSPTDWAAFAPLQSAATAYDAQGRKTRDTAFVGSVNPSVTQYSYDAAGRLTCTAVRMNPATFGALPASACTPAAAGSFGPDRISQTAHDALNRPLNVQDGVGTALQRTVRTQAYTLNGQTDWVEDAAGNRSDYAYDGFDRLIRLYFPMPATGAHAANPADYEAYEYDANDNPTGKRTRAGLGFSTTFDALNRIRVIDAPVGTQDLAFLYDNLDRRTAAYIPGGGLYYAMTWDALGRQTSETGPLGAMTSQYDLAGRRTRLTWPDAVPFYVNYTWDLDGAMRSITQGAAATPVTAYAYDNLGQRTGITRGNGVTTAYVLDNASYLTSLSQNPAGTTHDLTLGFSWNPAGQALSRSMSNPLYDFAPVNATTAYANNGLNQNTTVGGATLAWSAPGNLTSDGTRTFTYDAANRLTGTTGSALTWDPLERLYQMTGTDGGRFQYDGDQLATVYPAGSTTVAERYVRGPGADEWAVIYTGSGTGTPTYPLQNHQASVIARTDATGAATSTLAYDEYGRPRSGNPGRFQYTGQMMLPDYGLQHYKARGYHAELGRFVQTDPVGYEQGLNLYAYVGNDPVNAVDPTGMVSRLLEEDETVVEDVEVVGDRDEPCGFFCSTHHFLERHHPRTWPTLMSPLDVLSYQPCSGLRDPATGARIICASVPLDQLIGVGGLRSARLIAAGHAWLKHAPQFGALGIRTRGQFQAFIERIMRTSPNVKTLSGGRTAWWDDATGTVVIRNPSAVDHGTAFRPDAGRAYFEGLN